VRARAAFPATLTRTHMRSRLHRYCARMRGSLLDGEDAINEACSKPIANLRFDRRKVIPWLSRIIAAAAACTNGTRRPRFQRVDILPWMVRSQV
jgi:DNA-directed RNA polymerase specialized sigma24 family protein